MVKTALIVDDSRLARLTLKRLLSKYDIQVFEAEGVLDAEIWLSRNPLPDIVFMDIMMPELDGYEGLARLRAEPETRSLPVIMYSGDISDEARKKARDAGATGYLPKPADAGRLDHLLTALQERMRSELGARPTVAAPSAPPPPPAGRATEPTSARPAINIADAEKEFGLNTAGQSQPAPRAAAAPAAEASSEDINDLKRRIGALEKEISDAHLLLRTLDEKKTTAAQASPSLSAEIERHHKDVVVLQNKIAECEKQNKLSLIIGGGALLLGLMLFVWKLF